MSERRLRIAIAVAGLVGVAISGYLTYVHYADVAPICTGSGSCEKVQSSRYAELAGIPVAVLGLAGYLAIVATAFVTGELSRMAGTTLALAGFGFSLYLTYLELFVIDAICQWCVASAVTTAVLLGLTLARTLRDDPVGDAGAPRR